MGEHSLIQQIIKSCGSARNRLEVGIGDDCALFSVSPGFQQIISTDTLAEGVHIPFIKQHDRKKNFKRAGFRSGATALSDIAAMGGVPCYFFSSLHLNRKTTEEEVLLYFEGLKEVMERFNIQLAGGNVIRTDDANQFNLTVAGEVEEKRSLLRSGAKPGDILYITGWPGSASGGLQRILRDETREEEGWKSSMVDDFWYPLPAIDVGRFLVKKGFSEAAIDTSDGFLPDLSKLCEASGCGAVVRDYSLPVSGELRSFCREKGLDVIQQVCFGGDDYGLLFTVAKEHRFAVPPIIGGIRVAEVGEIVEGDTITLEGKNEEKVFSLPVQGYEHTET